MFTIPDSRRLFLWFVLLNALDAWTTTLFISSGWYELNPLYRYAWDYGGPVGGIIVTKAVALYLVYAFMWGKIRPVVQVALTMTFVVILANNANVISRYGMFSM